MAAAMTSSVSKVRFHLQRQTDRRTIACIFHRIIKQDRHQLTDSIFVSDIGKFRRDLQLEFMVIRFGIIPEGVPEEPAAVDEAGLQVWNQLFQALRDQHKAPILACIQNARFMGMTASQFQMRMQSGLMASLVMRNYRKTIERILQELTGRELRLVCSGEDAPMKAPPRPRIITQ